MKKTVRGIVCMLLALMLLSFAAAEPSVYAATKKGTKTKVTRSKTVRSTARKTAANTDLEADKELPKGTYEWKISLNRSIKGSRIKKVKKYKLLVIDAQNYSAAEIKKLKDAGHIVYSYLNIGSVESNRWYYGKFKDLRLKTYENWEDEYWVDVSEGEWRDFVIKRLAASMVKKGVDGFWVDNTDVYEYNKHSHIFNGLVRILTRLRKYNKGIILNGGDQFVTPLIKKGKKDLIDGVVQEEVTTTITSYSGNGSFSNHGRFKRYYENYFKRVKAAGKSVGVLEYTRSSSKRAKIRKYCKKHRYNYCISNVLKI